MDFGGAHIFVQYHRSEFDLVDHQTTLNECQGFLDELVQQLSQPADITFLNRYELNIFSFPLMHMPENHFTVTSGSEPGYDPFRTSTSNSVYWVELTPKDVEKEDFHVSLYCDEIEKDTGSDVHLVMFAEGLAATHGETINAFFQGYQAYSFATEDVGAVLFSAVERFRTNALCEVERWFPGTTELTAERRAYIENEISDCWIG